MHAVAYRNFPGRLAVKFVAFGSTWWQVSGNRGHNAGRGVVSCMFL